MQQEEIWGNLSVQIRNSHFSILYVFRIFAFLQTCKNSISWCYHIAHWNLIRIGSCVCFNHILALCVSKTGWDFVSNINTHKIGVTRKRTACGDVVEQIVNVCCKNPCEMRRNYGASSVLHNRSILPLILLNVCATSQPVQ